VTDETEVPAYEFDDSAAGRILRAARAILVADHYSGLTMDRLAHAVGMSKKTLYAHFASKDAICRAVIEASGRAVRREVEAAMDEPDDGFTLKLARVLSIISRNIALITPGLLEDLARFAPHIHRELDALKERNIPVVFGGILEHGIASGMVRPDVDVVFVVEFFLQAMKGLHEPGAVARTGATPQQAFDKAVDLFFQGVLTADGRADLGWRERR
jgi:AcrR family transcriptional regulator